MTHEERGVGVIEYSEVVATLNEKKLAKKRVQLTEEECLVIGKNAAVNGATNVAKRFKKTHPQLNFSESTARKLRDRYNENEITKQEQAILNKMWQTTNVESSTWWKSETLFNTLDEKKAVF